LIVEKAVLIRIIFNISRGLLIIRVFSLIKELS